MRQKQLLVLVTKERKQYVYMSYCMRIEYENNNHILYTLK
jgi:hypothetical protein